MTNIEKLYQEAQDNNVDIVTLPFESERIKGLYCDGTIALKDDLSTTSERSCILAEELGHHYTTVGDIIDQNNVSNRKQEQLARLWAYNKLIGLMGIIDVYKRGCRNIHEMAEHLEVTEEFLKDALEQYKKKYGNYTYIDNYIVFFEPTLGVLELKK